MSKYRIYILNIFQLVHLISGLLRHGISTRLQSDLHVNNDRWESVRDWYNPLSSDQLFYAKGMNIQSNSFVSHKEGIYFVSSNIILKNASVGTTVSLIVSVDDFLDLDEQKTLRATKMANAFGDLTVSISGFIFMSATNLASVYVKASSISTVAKQSSISIHHSGRIGFTPGFTAVLIRYRSFQKWTSTAPTVLFNSKQGFSGDSEKSENLGLAYAAPSTGIYMLTSNIIVYAAKPNLVRVSRLVNNDKINILTKMVDSIDTLNVNIILKLGKSDTIRLIVEAAEITVLPNSSMSVLLVDDETRSHSDISKLVSREDSLRLNMTKNMDKSILVELHNLPSITVLQPSERKLQTLSLPNVEGLICNRGSYYLAQFLLNYELTTREASFSTLTLLVGSHSMSATNYQKPTGYITRGSISLSGTLKCDPTKLIELKLKISNTTTVSFTQGSSFSLVEIRLSYPISLILNTPQTILDFRSGSIQHVGFHVADTVNLYLGNFFNDKEFHVPFTGIYFISANFLLKKTSEKSPISVGVSINGQIDETNGLYACAMNTNHTLTSLRIVSNVLLSENDVLNVYVKSRMAEKNIWTLFDTSKFFIVFLGKKLNVLGVRTSWISNRKLILKEMNLISALSETNNQYNYELGNWRNSTTQDKYSVPFSGIYIASCNVIMKTQGEQQQRNYKIYLAGDVTTEMHPVHDMVRSSEANEISLVAAGVFTLKSSNQLTCRISLDEPTVTIIKSVTISIALLSYEFDGSGFSVFLDSANGFSLGSSWNPVTGFSTNQFPGFKTADNYFDLNTGQYTPPEELFLIAFATLDLNEGNSNNLYEGAIELLKTSKATSELGLYTERFDSGFLSLHGVFLTDSLDQIRLVVRDKNNTDQFYQLRKGTGWSMYSVSGNIRYSPVMLTSIPERHGEPYIQRELSVDTIQSTVFPRLPGIYAFAATIDGWSSRNKTISEIIIHNVINSVLNVQAKATSIHVLAFHCNTECLTNGITVNSIGRIRSLALLKIGSFNSDGFSYHLQRDIKLSRHGRTYTMKDFMKSSDGHFGKSMIIIPMETTTYLITVHLNFNASGTFQINLIDNWHTIKLSKSTTGLRISYNGLLQLERGHIYHLNLDYTSPLTDLELQKDSSIAAVSHFNDNHPEVILLSTVKSNTILNLTSNQVAVLKGWEATFKKTVDMNTASTFYSCYSGTYLITANVIIRATTSSMIKLLVVYEDELDLPGLTVEAYFAEHDVNTLNIFTPMYLKEQRYVKLVMELNETGSVEILAGSSFSVSSIELDVGTSCRNVSEEIINSTVYISTVNDIATKGRNVTINCWSNYPYRIDFYWYHDKQVVWSELGVHESNLKIRNAQVDDSGVYQCEIRKGLVGKMSNQSTLKIIGMIPEVYHAHSNVSLDENVNKKVLLETFEAFAFISNEVEQYAQISASLSPTDSHLFTIEQWKHLDGVYTFKFSSVKPLDHELQSTYNITITFQNVNATILKSKGYTRKINIIIFVNNINEPPVFTYVPSKFNISENAAVGTICSKVEAIDDGERYFSILNGTSSSYFEIDKHTGTISSKASLDRESEDLYVIYVKVYDKEFSRYTEIKAYVTDVNDNAPYFKKPKYEVSVLESLTKETSILQLEAVDIDLEQNAELVFQIISNNDSRTSFDVTGQGVIVNKKNFDHLELQAVRLTVTVSDKGGLSSNGFCVVDIHILDINDNLPTFELSEYTVSKEEGVTGSLLQVKAMDNDTSLENRQITYYINDENMKKMFSVDPLTGLISTNKILDYEDQVTYDFKVFATDGRVAAGKTNVVINIIDKNDNSPIFQTANNITIPENTPINSVIFQIQATDSDSASNGNVRYFISFPSDMFSVDYATGYLKLLKTLDYELATSYTLKLFVTDSGPRNVRYSEQTFTILVSDINDNYPAFKQTTFIFDVKENEEPGVLVGCVVATDLDKDILMYNINEVYYSAMSTLFQVNSQTGCIETLVKFDREIQDVFNFAVEVTDQVEMPFSDYASVVIRITDQNDNPPLFPQQSYSIQISETTHIGQTIMAISAIDADVGNNGVFDYHIVSGNQNNNFLLMKENMILIKPLDMEKQSNYHLKVQASDGGLPSLSSTANIFITVIDRNDNQPYFQRQFYEVEIEENTPVGAFLLQVSAIDKDVNNVVTFNIKSTETSQENHFKINKTTGVIQTIQTLDYEKEKSFWLTVVATDNGKPELTGTAAVLVKTLDINDNPPTFEQTYVNVSIPLEAVVGMSITTVKASDLDSGTNGDVEYYQVSPNMFFQVNADTGEVSLAKKLTKTSAHHFTLQVMAKDKGSPSLYSNKVMIVNINVLHRINNEPVFTKPSYVISLEEDTLKGTVLKVIAQSPLNFSVIYSILPSQNRLPFIVDVRNGNVILFDSLDYEKEDIYVFYVKASVEKNVEDFSVAMVTIHVLNVNDNRPYFVNRTYDFTISEFAPIGLQVGQVSANDLDSGLFGDIIYSITSSQDENVFSLEKNSGIISVAGKLDYEKHAQYSLAIKAVDRGMPPLESLSSTDVKINIENVNDHQPLFDKTEYVTTVSESISIGTTILTLQVHDKDNMTTSVHMEIKHDDILPFFLTQAGDLVVTATLDREKNDRYDFIVQATDSRFKTTVNVRIFVEDYNDNAPIFTQEVYLCNVTESALPGTLLTVVSANDVDIGTSSQISYSVRSYQSIFTVVNKENDGQLFLSDKLDFESQSEYYVLISAKDNGSPYRMSTRYATVKIQVLDENDHAPQFLQNIYNLTIKETDSSVTKITAVDEDTGSNGNLKYHLLENLDSRFFNLNEHTGELVKSGAYPAGSRRQFSLAVTVSDAGIPKRTATVAVTLHVEDVNEFYPVFQNSLYTVEINENIPNGSFVAKIMATDEDNEHGIFQQMSYAIVSGNENKDFSIDDNGVLTTAGYLDREKNSQDRLIIQAIDNGRPMKVSQTNALVLVTILDENDNSPQFHQSEYNITILESTAIGTSVFQVTAVDLDSGSNSDLHFNLISSTKEKNFVVDQSGNLILKKSLRYAEKSLHRLLITATDKGEPLQRTGMAELFIHVQNVNDRPFFSPTEYEVTIPENVPVGFSVIALKAFDLGDTIHTQHLKYSIISGNPGNAFKLNGNTVVVNKNLDFESTQSYILGVQVFDNDQPPSMAEKAATIKINILNINDNQPYFDRSYYLATVDEEVPIASVVTQVKAFDNDQNAVFTYLLLYSEASVYFDIDSANGLITTKKRIDYEKLNHKQLSFVARVIDMRLPYMYTDANVIITVNDVNDHRPEFSKEVYQAIISETSSIGTIVLQLTASDFDSSLNGQIKYRTDDSRANTYFIVLDDLIILKNSLFDIEPKYFEFRITAMDAGFPPLHAKKTANVSIVVQETKHVIFRFSNDYYNVTISENWTSNDVIVAPQLISSRKSRNIIYRLEDISSHYLTINITTGEVSLKENIRLDYSKTDQLFALVTANDITLNTATTSIQIKILDINNHKPIFDSFKYEATIFKRTQIGTSILKVKASDNDVLVGAIVNYELLTQPTPFTINDQGEVILSESLSKYSNRTFELRITSYDNGQPPLYSDHVTSVYVHVTSLSGITPTFNKHLYNVFIPEGLPMGTEIFDFEKHLKILEATVQIKCSVEFDDNVVTAINNKLLTSAQFDMEKRSFYTALLSCKNGLYSELSSTAILHINILDVNDNPPVVDNKTLEVSVSESTLVGAIITKINAVDHDKGNTSLITFRILSGNNNHTFSISNSGQIVLKKTLDYEKIREYVLIVDIADRPNSLQRLTVVVNVHVLNENEFNPKFQMSQYEVTISERTDNSSSIFQVLASDFDDFGMINYAIQPKNVFDINPYSGVIQLRSTIDYEKEKVYDLTVIAKDNSIEPRYGFAELKVLLTDENDNKPVCDQSSYVISVSESQPIGTIVLHIVAKDLDEGSNGFLRYEIEKKSGDNIFSISSDGKIVLASALDYETANQHALKINISDSGVPPESLAVDVVINVVNVNEHSPKFTQKIFAVELPETTKPTTAFLQMSAFDLDDFGLIKYEIDNSTMFAIDEFNGKITLISPLDYEKHRCHEIVVIAKDNASQPLQSSAVIHIKVIDENDNFPIISNLNFQVTLSELTTIGTPVYAVQAHDLDEGKNSELRFEISYEQNENIFEISNNGVVYLQKRLDYESRRSYEVNVTVSDVNFPFHTANVSLCVNVLDENEFSPKFNQSQYAVTVLESTPIGSVLLQVSASDIDSFGGIKYDLNTITTINKTLLQIDESGKVVLVSQLDYEMFQEFIVIVSAKDNATSPLFGFANIRIKVIDENDNPPLPSFSKHFIQVSERTTAGSFLLSITLADLDQSSHFQYSIETGNQDKIFEVTENGILLLQHQLDFETTQRYNLSILTADAFIDPRHYARTNVIVQVLDENEHSPQFSKQLYEVSITESLPINTEILHVQATDGDPLNSIEYQISGLSSQLFTINNKTGMIRTSGLLDFEKVRIYNFIVKAKDDGESPRETSANVLVTIIDKNDNAPHFVQSIQYVKITKPLTEDEGFHDISVYDRDSMFNSVSFSIFSQHDINNKKWIDYFGINKTSSDRAVIVSKVKITENQNFTLKVLVSDEDGLTSNTTIYIDVQLRESDVRLPAALTDISKTTISLTLDVSKYFKDWKDRNRYIILAQEVHEDHEAFLTQTKLPPVTWKEVNKDGSENFMRRYYAIDYDYVTKIGRRRREVTDFSLQTGRISFVIGSEKACEKKVTCNGQLKADRIYRFQLMASGPNRPEAYSQFTQSFATSITSRQYSADTSSHYLFILSLSLSILGFIFLLSIMAIAWLLYKLRGSNYKIKEDTDDSSSNAFELTPRLSFPGHQQLQGSLFSGMNVRKDYEIHAIQVNQNEKRRSNPVFSSSIEDPFPRLALFLANANLSDVSQEDDVPVTQSRTPDENDDEIFQNIEIIESDRAGVIEKEKKDKNNYDTLEKMEHDQNDDDIHLLSKHDLSSQTDKIDVGQSSCHKQSSSSEQSDDTFNYKQFHNDSSGSDLTQVPYFDVTSVKPCTSDKPILSDQLKLAADETQHPTFGEEMEEGSLSVNNSDDGTESDTSLRNVQRLSVVQRQINEIEGHPILREELFRKKDSINNVLDKEKFRAIIDHWRRRSKAGAPQANINQVHNKRIGYVEF